MQPENSYLAPIALFVYNRPAHTLQTLNALKQNVDAVNTEIFVFSDAAKKETDIGKVQEVRQLITSLNGFKKVTLISQSENQGLAKSIISGVTNIVNEFGKVIVVEDDLITSKYFLRYMNEGLKKYESDDRVISIHGYLYPLSEELKENFFIRGADCWGWATWKRGWDLFSADGSKLLSELEQRKLQNSFDMDGSYPYTRMLKNQILGKVSSWAIRWHASAFLKGKLTLYPKFSLVQNIGHDSSGTHCDQTDAFLVSLADQPIPITDIPVVESVIGRKAFINYFKSSKPPIFIRIFNALKRKLK